jgi:Cu/Ag efflux protein CusF
MSSSLFALLFSAIVSLAAVGAHAQGGPSDIVEGEVRRIDKAAQKMTIRHGPLPNLDMPAMTMVFRVPDPKMLDQIKVGDKVRFETEKVDGAFALKSVEPLK